MRFGVALRELNLLIQIEHCTLRIIDGNWGVFETSFANHMHSYYELHYVSGGKGTLLLGDFEAPLARGCIYMIPPRVYHEQRTDSCDFLKEYHIAFILLSAAPEDQIYRQLLSKAFYRAGTDEAEALFDAVLNETQTTQYGYTDMILRYIQSIFILLVRTLLKPDNKRRLANVHLDDQRVMTTDEAFLYEYHTVTLSSLSSRLRLSPRQTQRFILEKYGAPFSILKTRSRLNHAAMLLSTTNLSVDEICFQIGYQNRSYFNRIFKICYRMTPSDYRKSHMQP